MTRHQITLINATLALVAGFAVAAHAGAEDGNSILFENHHFVPRTLRVIAGQPLVLKVSNASNETIEFESFKLNREIAMTPGERGAVEAKPPTPVSPPRSFRKHPRPNSAIA